MQFLTDINYSIDFECPYIKDLTARFSMFHARELTSEEIEKYISAGFRKFGTFFFKPQCYSCQKCVPIRVLTEKLTPSKSQRRALRKAQDVQVVFSDLEFRDEIYEIYCDHSQRFRDKHTDIDDFITTFYVQSCPGIQSEYYLNGKLFAAGFLDVTSQGFSSVYFMYLNAFSYLSPGTISVFYECEEARKRNLKYYYLGYYIEENRSMNYKIKFSPNELYNWNTAKWNNEDTPHYIGHTK